MTTVPNGAVTLVSGKALSEGSFAGGGIQPFGSVASSFGALFPRQASAKESSFTLLAEVNGTQTVESAFTRQGAFWVSAFDESTILAGDGGRDSGNWAIAIKRESMKAWNGEGKG